MTRISARELVDDPYDVDEEPLSSSPLDQSKTKNRAFEHYQNNITVRTRERSPSSKLREESPSKMPRQEPRSLVRDRSKRRSEVDSLIFETRMYNRHGENVTLGAVGMVVEEAAKLSWKNFKHYLIRNGGIEKFIMNRKNDLKVYYVDEEKDEIFVDSDDEYKEVLKVAAERNKDGKTMILNFIGTSKTRRTPGERKLDILAREKTYTGKVMKQGTIKNIELAGGKLLKVNTGRVCRSKYPGRIVNCVGSVPYKHPSLSIQIPDKSCSIPLLKANPMAPTFPLEVPSPKTVQSPVNHDILKQNASIFDWISSTTSGCKESPEAPPAWFNDYMENFKDELSAEISAKVVHSLGIIMENKLAGFEKKKTNEAKTQTKPKDDAVKNKDFKEKNCKHPCPKKVQKEVLRMSMELNEDTDSKEMKKLKKKFTNRQDKAIKVAMKIEKKQKREDRQKTTDLTPTVENKQKLERKKEKSEARKEKSHKMSKESPATKAKVSPVKVAVLNYPLADIKELAGVPTSPKPAILAFSKSTGVAVGEEATESISLSSGLKWARKKHTVADQLFLRQLTGGSISLDNNKPQGKLASAVYLSEKNRLVQQVKPGEKVRTQVRMVNMGCLPWSNQTAIHLILSSEGLSCSHHTVPLPALLPGEEGMVRIAFTAPKELGAAESIWHFYDGADKFGPPLKFKFIVKPTAETIVLKNKEEVVGKVKPDVEMVTFNNEKEGTEMKEIGSSRRGQEMVEFKKKKDKDCIITISESLQNSVIEEKEKVADEKKEVEAEDVLVTFKEDHFEENDNFDLLASEIDSLCLSEDRNSKPETDDFELIPIPDCFNLDIPFEIIQNESTPENMNKESSKSKNSLSREDGNEDTDDEAEYVDSSDAIEEQSENLPDSYHSTQTENEHLDKKSKTEMVQSISVSGEIPSLQGLVKGVLSNISSLLTVEPPSPTLVEPPSHPLVPYTQPMERLVEMGFANREHNQALLNANNNNLTKVISSLLSENDGTWAQKRH